MKRKERSMKKRLFAIALVLMLALTLLPVMTYADDEGGENTQNEIIRRTCFLCKQYCDKKLFVIRQMPVGERTMSCIM